MSVRHDWYQSETSVVISVLLKNAKDRNGQVKIEKDRVEVTADDYSLDLKLFREVNVEKSSYKMMSSKIEISLAKIEGIRWECLEKTDKEVPIAFAGSSSVPAASPPPHPSNKKNWDRMAKEIEKTEAEEMQVSDGHSLAHLGLQNLSVSRHCLLG